MMVDMAELFEQYEGALMYHVQKEMTLQKDEARSVAFESFVRAARAYTGDFDDVSSSAGFLAYLHATVKHNMARARLRAWGGALTVPPQIANLAQMAIYGREADYAEDDRLKKRVDAALANREGEMVLFEDLAEEPFSALGRSPEDLLSVQSCFKYLTKAELEVVVLTLEGWNQSEVATLIGKSRQTVSKTYRKAVNRLKEVL